MQPNFVDSAQVLSKGYSISIKSFLFWKKYTVVGHSINTAIANHPRLILSFADESVIIIPGIDRKLIKVHSDFPRFEEARKAMGLGSVPKQERVVPAKASYPQYLVEKDVSHGEQNEETGN